MKTSPEFSEVATLLTKGVDVAEIEVLEEKTPLLYTVSWSFIHCPIITPRSPIIGQVPLTLDHSYLVGELKSLKIADTKVSEF